MSGMVDWEKDSNPEKDGLTVDAAWSPVSKKTEFRGVRLSNKKEIFSFGPFGGGTNNVGEFLAIVNAMAYLKKNDLNIPIYSDSRTAISWVRNKCANTDLKNSDPNTELMNTILKAERWLKDNVFLGRIIKWNTRKWGEIPADYGRK